MIRSKDPLKGSPLRDQLPGSEGALRPIGHVEVVKLRRRSRKHPELLLFKGEPASSASVAKSVQITIAPANGELPPPHFGKEKGRIHLYYGHAEHPDVLALTGDPGACVCYLWTSGDGKQSHAWLLKTR